MIRTQFIVRAGWVPSLAVLSVALAPKLASAADAPLGVSLEYSAEDGCPDEKAFLEEVSSRTTRLVVAAESSPALVLRAHLRQGGEHQAFRGTLVFVRDASESAREVEGASCQEVAEALAVVVAMALEPERGRTRRALSASGRPLAPRTEPTVPPPALETVSEARSRSFLAATGFGAGVTSVVAPWPAWYGEIALELRRPLSTPAVRGAFSYAGRGSYQTEEGTSSFRWLGGRLEACLVALPFTRALALEPWIGFEAGAIGTTGRTANGSASRWVGWAAPDATVRMRWSVAEPVTVSFAAGGALPLVRSSFYLTTPERTVFRPPVIGLRAGIEAAMHFW